MIVFASDRDLQNLYENDRVVADGTFTYRPREVAQLYVLFAFINGK